MSLIRTVKPVALRISACTIGNNSDNPVVLIPQVVIRYFTRLALPNHSRDTSSTSLWSWDSFRASSNSSEPSDAELFSDSDIMETLYPVPPDLTNISKPEKLASLPTEPTPSSSSYIATPDLSLHYSQAGLDFDESDPFDSLLHSECLQEEDNDSIKEHWNKDASLEEEEEDDDVNDRLDMSQPQEQQQQKDQSPDKHQIDSTSQAISSKLGLLDDLLLEPEMRDMMSGWWDGDGSTPLFASNNVLEEDDQFLLPTEALSMQATITTATAAPLDVPKPLHVQQVLGYEWEDEASNTKAEEKRLQQWEQSMFGESLDTSSQSTDDRRDQ